MQPNEQAKAEAEGTVESTDLTQEELAFFESGGEKPIEEKPAEGERQEEQKAEGEDGEKAKAEGEEDAEADDGDDAPLKEGEDGNKGRFVRHGAFHQERERRKALEKELATERDRIARVDERLKIINEAMTRQAPAEEQVEEMPDPEKDVFGALNYALKKIQTLEGGLGETKKASEQSAQQNELLSTYRSDATRFAQANPDFGNAYQFAMQARDKELEALGYADPAMRMRMIAEEEQWIVTEALKVKQSPSERIYNFAKVKGYKKAEPEKKADEEKAANGDADKMGKIQKGQAASKSLSGVGGSASGVMTAEALANMNEEEFEAWMEKTPKSLQRALLGG
jgi:hypothetical protein